LKFRFLLVLIILYHSVSSFAQEYKYVPFPQSDAIWSEMYVTHEDSPPIYERFALNGEDTVIGTYNYKKIYMFLDTVFDKSTATYVGGLREDSDKKVWFKDAIKIHDFKPFYLIPDSEEILLYDFSVNVGDTIKKGNFDVFFPGAMGYGNSLMPPIIVNQIDTIRIGNSLRKKIQFNWWVGEWIEGIGSTLGLFITPQVDHPTCTCNDGRLIGFKYQGEILYFNEMFSEFYPTAIQPIENQSSKISIKQLQNREVQFDFGNNNISFLWIYNMTGRLQQSYDIKMQRELILSGSRFAPGIYIYRASDFAGNNYSGKFVIK